MSTTSRTLVAITTLTLTAGACADRAGPTETELRTPIFEQSSAAALDKGGGDQRDNDHHALSTRLRGGNEVPPNESRARGVAVFKVSRDGESIRYVLEATKFDNPFMAHIHMAAAGVNGPIVVWLFPSTTPTPGPLGIGRFDGRLAKGTITAANLVGPLAGHPLAELIDAIRSGNAYVNVHTNDGVAPVTNTPGDIPGGEIRGQLGPRERHHD
jgi:hypothetical protein